MQLLRSTATLWRPAVASMVMVTRDHALLSKRADFHSPAQIPHCTRVRREVLCRVTEVIAIDQVIHSSDQQRPPARSNAQRDMAQT